MTSQRHEEFYTVTNNSAYPSDRAIQSVVLRPFDCWVTGLNAAGGRKEGLSLLSVVFCKVELSGAGRSLVRRSAVDCVCVYVCDPDTSAMRNPEPTRAVEVLKRSVIQT